LVLTVLELVLDALHGLVILALHRFKLSLNGIIRDCELEPFVALDAVDHFFSELRALLDALRRRRSGLSDKHLAQAVPGRTVEDVALVLAILLEAFDFLVLDRAGTVVDLDTVTVEDADFDDRAGNARRQTQRGIADVRSLFTEDGAKQLFFRRHRAFALRRDLADQDVARMHFRTDVDNARF